MKLMLIVVLTLAAIYAGYWVLASRGLDRGLRTGLSALEAQGWQVATDSLTTGGFPSRFDVTATDLTVTSPTGGLTWTSPWVQTVALAYRPNRVIVALPPEQTLMLGRQTLTVGSTGLRASVGVAANTQLSFDDLTAEAKALSVTSDAGWSVNGGAALLALRQQGPAVNAYEAYLGLADVMPGLALPSAPDVPAQLTADATVVLDRPLDRKALLPTRPLITALTLNSLNLTWGALHLTGSGDLTVDAAGVPTGQLMLKADGWQDAIGLLAEAGIVQPQVLPTLTGMATMMAGDSGALALPITFKSGNMALGPLPLGPAPRLLLP